MSQWLPNSLSLLLGTLVTATGLAGAALFSTAQPQVRSLSTSLDGRFKVIVETGSGLALSGSRNATGTAHLYDTNGQELAQTSWATAEPPPIQWAIETVSVGSVVWTLPRSHDPNILLFQAALKGDRATFQQLLPQANIQFKTSHQSTLLHAAVRGGNLAIVQELLDRNLDINARDSAGDTALFTAIRQDAIEMTQLLLQQGADVNEPAQSGQIPLLIALQSGSIKLAQLLIQQGAAVNTQDQYGITALHLAAKLGNTELLQALIDRGALLNPLTPNGMSPLTYVIEGKSPAAQKQRSVDVLVAAGASFEVPVLQRALMQGDKSMVDYLIRQGANVNFPNPIDGSTPLLQVVKSEKLTGAEQRDLIDRLLSKGANLNAADLAGHTPLSEAVLHYSNQSLPLIELLLKRGAAVNTATADQLTPLMLMAQTAYPEVSETAKSNLVQLLIRYGANINARNPQGKTAIDLATDPSVQQQLRAAI